MLLLLLMMMMLMMLIIAEVVRDVIKIKVYNVYESCLS